MASLDGKNLKQVIDPTVAKAFTHPLRGHVWVTLFERGMVSPTEIANELDIDVSEVSYHFRELKKRKLIKLARTVQRRGFDEHFYEPIAPVLCFDDAAWMELPAGIRASFSGEMLGQVIDALTEALAAGSFDARDRHLSQSWLLVDERGWKELMRAVERTLKQVMAIQDRCAERRRASSDPGIPVAVVMASFETPKGHSGHQEAETDAL
jgi:DNA-binding transcriptional ArsR family regulator